MTNRSLLGATALPTVLLFSFAAATPAMAAAQPTKPAEACQPGSAGYDPNTKNCTQPAEGQQGTSAPGTNPGTAPSDEQPTPANSRSSENTIIVTGSRIPRPQFEGTIPGAQVTQQQIQTRAFTNALDILNDIPLVGPGASPFGTNGGQPGSLGASFVDLLDLGTNRTLTLLNGRRFVSGNQGTLFVSGNTTGSQVDLNVIPAALISRIDVLTVGGAAAYGSDAVAGVVNVILVDDYDGVQVGGLAGLTQQNDGFNWRVTAIAGKNFLDRRANVTVSFEHDFDAALTADQRREYYLNPLAPTYYLNGGIRNPAFQPIIGANTNAGTGAFLPSFADQTPGNFALPSGLFGGTFILSDGGTVFANPGTISGVTQGPYTTVPGTTPSTGTPIVGASVAGNTQLIPGVPVSSTLAGCTVTNLTTFCNFAPSSLPGSGAAQTTFVNAVIAQYAPAVGTSGTAAERSALAIQLLQANKPTPREYFAANPTTDPNLFIGRFVNYQQATTTPAFLTVANTNPATSALFPRRAVPLFFDNSGNLVDATTCITPTSAGTAGGAPCSNMFQNPSFYNILRVQQKRDIGNLFAHFDLNDHITLYTENLYARVNTLSPQNNIASANTVGSTTGENGAILLSINNPFLDAGDRAKLIAAGVTANTGTFLLSRTNQDLAPGGRLPITNVSTTYRTVGGVKGTFGLFGETQRYDASITWGRNDSTYKRLGILDTEYALALDAVTDSSGKIVCRATIDPTGALGTRGQPRGVGSVDIIRVPQADGSYKETIVVRSATPEQISSCVPLNPFGFGQSSEAARQYVTAQQVFQNRNDQLFGQSSLAGNLIHLPGGPLGYALSADYRKDKIDFQVDPNYSATGRTRTAVLARTQGTVENVELGVEARIPIFGDDFHIPLFRNLDFTPAVRFVNQWGDAPDVTLLSGQRVTNQVKAKWNKIYSLAGTWRPISDITFRGNYTRSLRQPSVVELFLGGQPAFNAYTDPCSNNQIGGGNVPTIRRANCEAAVIAAGFATNQAGAQTFLSTFVNPGNSITGTFVGSPDLKPERGRSFTVGAAANPHFIPGLRLSTDYINVKLLDRIVPTTLTQALQICFDDPNYPDTSASVGVNVCNFFRRATSTDVGQPQFILQNGFGSGFINLGALQVKALNSTISYNVPIGDWFNHAVGKLELYGNVYHLIHYKTASNGKLDDPDSYFDLSGDFSHPKWEVQAHARYEHPSGAYGQWTTNWQSRTCAIGSADVCATIEEFNLLKIPAIATHDATIGYSWGPNKRFNLQLAVINVTDKRFAVPFPEAIGLGIGGVVDTFGRRYRVSATAKF
jgi:outer membrane receptor protein involved in Fe transport